MEKPQKTTRRVRGAIKGLDETARMLRHELTPAEKKLWNAIRDHKLDGLKFRRQHPIGHFVLDFFCAEHRLAVEVDGEVHNQQIAHDEERSRMLSEFGYVVLRFRNEEVLEDLVRVLEKIGAAALTPRPPLPILGEGENGVINSVASDIEYSIARRNRPDKAVTDTDTPRPNRPSPRIGRGAGGEGQ